MKHKHAELIKAWADGAVIECEVSAGWYTCSSPTWSEDYEYRIKPELSDLEKYGIEVGDVWGPPKCYPQIRDYISTVGGVRDGRMTSLYGSPLILGSESVLLFRRGVVNKL